MEKKKVKIGFLCAVLIIYLIYSFNFYSYSSKIYLNLYLFIHLMGVEVI